MVERLKQEYEASVEWKPFLLHPDWPEEGVRSTPPTDERFKVMRARLKQIAAEAGLPFVELELRPNSRRAMEASEYARSQGKYDGFHRIVFNKLFGYGQDIHDWKVLRAAAAESGMDADEMQREVENGKYREELNNLLAEVQVLNITIVPTYIINGKYSIAGDQPYEEFKRIIQQTD